ncbi:MAG: helix-turn-helix transcriptional regulator [Oscillospiraceae bacterium]|nr:helix-turn-helix transcriptional regulator [Oscillospiraceae bacterium]
MVVMDLRDILRDICGAARVQFLLLSPGCGAPEASALDYQFRAQLYENFNYAAMAAAVMALVPDRGVIDYKDEFGLHYLVFPAREDEGGGFFFIGPFLYRAYTEENFRELLRRNTLSDGAVGAIRWYFKRVPVVGDVIGWRQMFSTFLSRYLGNPDLLVNTVRYDRPERAREKPSVALSAIPYTSIEARYEAEAKMLDAIRRGDISEATYYQNIFMGYRLDQRIDDPLRNAKDMVIAASTAMRKAVQQAEVHPLYIDSLSGQLLREIEEAENEVQVGALVPRMIRNYCLLVQTYSRERFSGVVRDVLNFVDFHYMEPLSLESLSGKYAVNKNYLSTRFHKEVGMTVTDYINLTRVRRSLKLLSGTNLSMPEIAERCGFSDANYYTRTFKKVHGTTPTEYRRSLQPRERA